jgi:superfamily II DNA/RNA helicase
LLICVAAVCPAQPQSCLSQVDILAGTPLLAGKLIKSARLQLGNTRFLVLDEGDRLLDDQFIEQVDAVLAACTSPHLVRMCIFDVMRTFASVYPGAQ